MELHLFIFLATQSGPASFQPAPSPGAPETCPVGGRGQRDPRALLQMPKRPAWKEENTKEWATNRIPTGRRHWGLPLAHVRALDTKETGPDGGCVGAPLLSVLYLVSYSLICVICGGWTDDKQQRSGIQENMEKEGSGVTHPHFSNQRSTL